MRELKYIEMKSPCVHLTLKDKNDILYHSLGLLTILERLELENKIIKGTSVDFRNFFNLYVMGVTQNG